MRRRSEELTPGDVINYDFTGPEHRYVTRSIYNKYWRGHEINEGRMTKIADAFRSRGLQFHSMKNWFTKYNDRIGDKLHEKALKKSTFSAWKKAAGLLSGGTVGFITGNVPGAVVGAELGYAAANGENPLSLANRLVAGTTGVNVGELISLAGNVVNRRQSLTTSEMDVDEPTNLPENNSSMATPRTPRRRRVTGGTTPGSSRSYSSALRRYNRSRPYRRRRGFRYRVKKKYSRVRRHLKKLKRRKRKKSAKKEKYLANTHGIARTRETYGKVVANHAVYLKHSTWNDLEWANAITGALIRKLLTKAGLDVTHVDDIIQIRGSLFNNSDLRIVYIVAEDGAPTTNQMFAIDITNVGPMYTIQYLSEGFTGMRNHLIDYVRSSNKKLPVFLDLQYHEITEDIFMTHTRIDLAKLKIHYHASSVLKIQNRTLPPNSTQTTSFTDTVDNQPLSGRLYTFKGGDPKLSEGIQHFTGGQADAIFNGINGEGFEGAFDAGESYNMPDPPPKHYWKNCTKTAPALIQVGESQQTGVSHAFVGGFITLLNKIRDNWDSQTRYHCVPGKSQILALTEYLHTANTNKITVGYERRLRVGVWFTTMKKTITFVPTFTTPNEPIDFTQ